ncbi:MAG: CoA pyrophosphatase [bacterium]
MVLTGLAPDRNLRVTISEIKFNRSPMKQSSQNIPLICDQTLLSHIRSNLERLEVIKHPREGSRRAAVAVTIVDIADDPGVYGISGNENRRHHGAVVLTRRAAGLKNHSGQWSFPGGRLEPGENPETAALRELEEEVGLHLGPEQIIGYLDDFTTRSGFVMTPVVLWGGPNLTLHPDPGEVRSVHRVPLEELLREDAPILERIPESEHPVLLMPVGSSWIATPTGAILYQFREVAILGRSTRVAHYEQPYFAWS